MGAGVANAHLRQHFRARGGGRAARVQNETTIVCTPTTPTFAQGGEPEQAIPDFLPIRPGREY